MYQIEQTTRFKKDLRRVIRRGYDMQLITKVVDTLASGKPLPEIHRDHALSGGWAQYRECHISPDWLLIYRKDNQKLILVLTGTGTHSDLF
ncbi:MAG: type II toxin-antitoxin system YafQ family toxin [Clostridiales bacterium]|nr:type II toxin-antitoxin system YafQ family toxin [Clostridiales bacterium]